MHRSRPSVRLADKSMAFGSLPQACKRSLKSRTCADAFRKADLIVWTGKDGLESRGLGIPPRAPLHLPKDFQKLLPEEWRRQPPDLTSTQARATAFARSCTLGTALVEGLNPPRSDRQSKAPYRASTLSNCCIWRTPRLMSTRLLLN